MPAPEWGVIIGSGGRLESSVLSDRRCGTDLAMCFSDQKNQVNINHNIQPTRGQGGTPKYNQQQKTITPIQTCGRWGLGVFWKWFADHCFYNKPPTPHQCDHVGAPEVLKQQRHVFPLMFLIICMCFSQLLIIVDHFRSDLVRGSCINHNMENRTADRPSTVTNQCKQMF